jgi:hypothetical protein
MLEKKEKSHLRVIEDEREMEHVHLESRFQKANREDYSCSKLN